MQFICYLKGCRDACVFLNAESVYLTKRQGDIKINTEVKKCKSVIFFKRSDAV